MGPWLRDGTTSAHRPCWPLDHWDSACSDSGSSSESDAQEAEEVNYKPRQVPSSPDATSPFPFPCLTTSSPAWTDLLRLVAPAQMSL